jgi:DNA-binding NtrC family response regulator
MHPKVLIVETEDCLRENLAVRLQLEAFKVYQASNVEQASRILQKRKIDVVLLGLVGLKESGLTVLETLNKTRSSAQAILMNSPEQLSLSIAGMKMGAFDDLLMPVDLSTLLAGIGSALEKKRENEKRPRSLLQRCQDIMVAVSFAEAGEPDLARKMLEEAKKDDTVDAGQNPVDRPR